MTASQAICLYELTLEFIPDEDKAKKCVSQIEEVVEQKFKDKETVLATKIDLTEAKLDIIKWLVATSIAATALVVTLVKLL